MSTSTWPDRATYAALMQHPDHHLTDPELAGASYARGALGMLASWNGARAMVFKAELRPGEHCAVRFLLNDEPSAGVRYDALDRHLSVNPVPSMVRTRWLPEGVRHGSSSYPVIKMDWVDGAPLDPYLEETLSGAGGAARVHQLADAWLLTCRRLTDAQVSHGDVHAGNTMVTQVIDGPAAIRLVDYDNVWVPGLHAVTAEAGHPAFQHPRSAGAGGPSMDALPNALTYLSLLALAADPTLWRYHEDSDDTLLFTHADLADPDAQVWAALLGSPDSTVVALTAVTVDWLRGAPDQFHTLDQVLAEIRHRPVPAPHPAPPLRNSWPTARSAQVEASRSPVPSGPSSPHDPSSSHGPSSAGGVPGASGPSEVAGPRDPAGTRTPSVWPQPSETPGGTQVWSRRSQPEPSGSRRATGGRIGLVVAIAIVVLVVALAIALS